MANRGEKDKKPFNHYHRVVYSDASTEVSEFDGDELAKCIAKPLDELRTLVGGAAVQKPPKSSHGQQSDPPAAHSTPFRYGNDKRETKVEEGAVPKEAHTTPFRYGNDKRRETKVEEGAVANETHSINLKY